MSSDPGLFHLSRTERYMAFGACFVIGLVLSILGTVLIFSGHMTGFAVCYSMGNVISLFGMGFLIGFKRQLKMATAPVRLTAFLVYIILLVLTFVFAFAVRIAILCLILAICQFCALAWYSASYIPFGRKMIKGMCSTCAKAI
ncbi:SFT2-like protein [Martensiomyces pterosporus]|nr:SFT2-like protein [Martensiomyces pterosporus]